MRAIRITTFVLLFLLMLTLAALVVALGVALALHESHRASRSDSCAQLASLPAVRPEPLPRDALRSGLDLARLTDIAPPAGFRAVRGYPRALDLTAAAATRNDPREGRRVLTRYRFSHGFERRWERGDELALVSAWEFATPADARAYDAYATSHVCGLVTRVSWTPGIAGSVGLRFPVDRFTADQVSFVRGPYRIVAFLRSPKLESTQRRIANLAGVAAQRARQAAERS
jgi:hypothetical protein